MALSYKEIYPIPSDLRELKNILDSIPCNSSCIDGLLLATEALYQRNEVCKHTRLKLSSKCKNLIYIVGAQDTVFERSPLEGIPESVDVIPNGLILNIGNVKLYSSVAFDMAGLNNEAVSYKIAQDIATECLLTGYKGRLSIYHRIKDTSNPSNFLERISLSHYNKINFRSGEIKIEIRDDLGGNVQRLKQFISSLGENNTEKLKQELIEAVWLEDYEKAKGLNEQLTHQGVNKEIIEVLLKESIETLKKRPDNI